MIYSNSSFKQDNISMEKQDIKELTRLELNELLIAHRFKECHSRDILKAVYKQGVKDFSTIIDIPKTLHRFMDERFYISNPEPDNRQVSEDGTEKFTIPIDNLDHKDSIECVYIPETQRGTLCVSSQVGCRFGCVFCVSGRSGFVRNLTTAEMVSQVTMIENVKGRGTISNVVFMGTGEPLDNYDNLIRAVNILHDPSGLGIARKRISISTCGLVPGIERLIKDKLGLRLSISLHGTTNEKRSALMPINKKYSLELLKESAREFSQVEGFPVFFEYIMIKGLNTSPEDARSLAEFVKGLNCKINLIPCNPSPYYSWQPPEPSEIDAFRFILEELGVFYWIRKSRGKDIAAACGLLRERNKS